MSSEGNSIVAVDGIECKMEEKSCISKKMAAKKRKLTIFKKTEELSTLCDVESCTVVVETDRQVSTWPENWNEVLKIIHKYKDGRKKKKNSVKSKEFESMQMNSVGDHGNLLEQVELKLTALDKRIESAKSSYSAEEEEGTQNPYCLLKSVPYQSAIEMLPTYTPCFFDQYAGFPGMAAPPVSSFDGFSEQFYHGMAPTCGFNGSYNQQIVPPTPDLYGFGECSTSIDTMNQLEQSSLGVGGATEQFDYPQLNSNNFFGDDFFSFNGY